MLAYTRLYAPAREPYLIDPHPGRFWRRGQLRLAAMWIEAHKGWAAQVELIRDDGAIFGAAHAGHVATRQEAERLAETLADELEKIV